MHFRCSRVLVRIFIDRSQSYTIFFCNQKNKKDATIPINQSEMSRKANILLRKSMSDFDYRLNRLGLLVSQMIDRYEKAK